MEDEVAPAGLTGIDLDFIHRVYRTSLVLVLIAAVLLWEALGAPSALGWMAGALLGLGMLAGVEWSVRRFIRPEAQTAGRVLGASLAKLGAAALALILAFLAARRGWLSLVWVLLGFTLPHAVIVLKLAGRILNARMRTRKNAEATTNQTDAAP
jgi:hypothetical protein